MKTPVIIINFKAYAEALNSNGLRLAKVCDLVSRESRATIAVAPQHIDLREIKSETAIPVFSQHIDPVEKAGAYTGHMVAENLKNFGVSGSLVNHSERKVKMEDVEKSVGILKKFGLVSVCCAATVGEAEQIAKFGPDFIAIEPPELIGSGVSVSTSKPEVVVNCVGAVRRINPQVAVLCGAGITKGADVRRALELGAKGVLVASGVVKAADPKKVLEDFVGNM